MQEIINQSHSNMFGIMTRHSKRILLALLRNRRAYFIAFWSAIILTSCTYVPYDHPKSISQYIADPGGSSLSKQLEPLEGGDTKAVVLYDGDDALAARLQMIENAEHTLDLQYFLVKPDEAGLVIAAALVDAAGRGVRVRFLIDDVFTTASDTQLNYLNSIPNIEVRFFNPLSRNAIQPINYILDFNRFNRRMHNKSMTADGVVAVVGGRNLANEYYEFDLSHNFADFDILVTGQAVDDIGKTFDLFWNDRYAVPLEALHPQLGDAELRAIATSIDETERESFRTLYKDAAQSDYLNELANGNAPVYRATSNTLSDHPQKLRTPPPRSLSELDKTAAALVAAMQNAQHEIYLLTPYFVPRDWAVTLFLDLEKRGVDVHIVTNSLASTNHPYVQGGYVPHRKRLVEAGVDIYEIRVDALDTIARSKGKLTDTPALTMHTKLAVIDRETSFIGSLNFDPRSIELNTEFGLLLHDKELSTRLTNDIEEGLADYSYHLEIDADGALIWVYYGNAPIEILTKEPDASLFDKLLATITSVLPIEGQL